MKIKFLGTSAGWPLPRLGCKCEICSSKNPKDTRTRTQILIDDKVLLDAGPETYRHLDEIDSRFRGNDKKGGGDDKKENKTSFSTRSRIQNVDSRFRGNDRKAGGNNKMKDGNNKGDRNNKGETESIAHKLKAVLISHAHPDHILGLWDLPHIYGRSENEVDKIKLFVTREVLNNIRNTFFSQFQPIVVSVQKPFETFNIDHAKVTYFPVIHGKTAAFGIKYKDGKFIAYIPDFNRILPSSQKVIRDCHVLIIDGSSLGKLGQTPTHISITDGIAISKKLRAKSTYFVHVGHKTGTHQFLENYLRQNAGPNFHIAYDGLELTV